MLNATLNTTAVLFTVANEKRAENGPIMTGSINVDDKSVYVGAFLRISEESQREYLSLSCGSQSDEKKYYGCLFRTMNKKTEDSPDYHGFITLEDNKQLRLFGRRKRAKDSKIAFIAIDVVSPEGAFEDNELPL